MRDIKFDKKAIQIAVCLLVSALPIDAQTPASLQQRKSNAARIITETPHDDFFAIRSAPWTPTVPPLWFDPMASDKNRFAADSTNWFNEWRGDPAIGKIRYIYHLGIHPLGTHSPSIAKDSLMLSSDEWSGGFPCIYFSHSVPCAPESSPLFGKARMFDIERACYDSAKDRWFSQIVFDAPKTTFGVAAIDGANGNFIFEQYQIGMKRGGDGDWLAGTGPLANLPGGKSLIPGVLAKLPEAGGSDADLYPPTGQAALVGWPLFGRGPLGLTEILRGCHKRGQPFSEVPDCICENPTLFDYDENGRPLAFAANLYMQAGNTDASGKYTGMKQGALYLPAGAEPSIPSKWIVHSSKAEPMLLAGYWTFRFNPQHADLGWQLDPNSRIDIGLYVLNYVHGSNQKFLTSDWGDSSVIEYDAQTGTKQSVLRCHPSPHAALGEPSGSPELFTFLGTRSPYFGAAFGLDKDVWEHDIYLASAYPIESRNGHFVEPKVVDLYRNLLGCNPDAPGAFRLTATLRSGATTSEMRQSLLESDFASNRLRDTYIRIFHHHPSAEAVNRCRSILKSEGSWIRAVQKISVSTF